jgi:DNA-binding transcriptional ArsR family regulator
MTTTTDKLSTEQKVIDALAAQEEATVDEVAAALGIGRTSARKHLAALQRAGKVKRGAGGREGKRKLPDRYSLAGEEQEAAPRPEPPRKGSGERLRPGQLDGLVLGYLREHAADGPLSPSAVGKGLARSSGATANSLDRLASREEVSQVSQRPRRYELKS